ncbi:hypothetical protein JHK84_034500 [Glycine max]|nr:hypothetical protein JHK85_034876 [Glycine max]KAG5140732.1 hypothetical protein JHK84_034500 [Glycine max]
MISANCCWLIDGEDVLEAREAWPKYWLIVTLVPATRTRPGCSGRPRAMFNVISLYRFVRAIFHFKCLTTGDGKTTVCHSISQNFSASSLSYFDQVRTKLTTMEQAVKTAGMKIKSFKDEDTRISIWNIAESIARTLSWDDSCANVASPYPLKPSLASLDPKVEDQDWDKYANLDDTEPQQLHQAKRRQKRSNQKLVFDSVNIALIEITGYVSEKNYLMGSLCSGSHSRVQLPEAAPPPPLVDLIVAQMKELISSAMRSIWVDCGDSNSPALLCSTASISNC